MKYKNPCKFPVYVKGNDKTVQPGEIVELKESGDVNILLKECKLIAIITEQKEEPKVEEKKSKKKDKTKKSDEYSDYTKKENEFENRTEDE